MRAIVHRQCGAFRDEAGTAESNKRAATYLKENLAGVAAGPPQIIEGETVIAFT